MSAGATDGKVRRLLPDRAIESLGQYLNMGGGQAIGRALSMAPEKLIAEVKCSGLGGRGGAGFPTGVKWASVADDPCPTKYLFCNGAEGEPGAFKGRCLMRNNPYQLLEGMAIARLCRQCRKSLFGDERKFPGRI